MTTQPVRFFKPIPWNEAEAVKFCLDNRGINPQGMKLVNAQFAIHDHYREKFDVVAVPVCAADSTTTGYCMLPRNGKSIRTGSGPDTFASVKKKLTLNCKPGFMGARDRLSADSPILMLEGATDLMAAASFSDLPDDWTLLSPSHGAGQKFPPDWAEDFRGKFVAVVYDNDSAGASGSQKLLAALLPLAREVRIVNLPGTKDLRDWKVAGGTFAELHNIINATPPATGNDIAASNADDPAAVAATCDTAMDDQPGGENSEAGPAEDASLYVPRMLPFDEFIAAYPVQLDEVIEGLLRKAEILNLISTSKSGKTFKMLMLAICIATGRDFLGFKTRQGRVLIIDAELQPETLRYRLQTISEAMGIDPKEIGDSIIVESLRKFPQSILDLPHVYSQIKPGEFVAIMLDPIYRFWPDGFNENDNAAMGRVYSMLAAWSAEIEAAIICVHHPAKGDTSERSVIDMGSGAGSIGRACDSQIAIYPHAESNGNDGLAVAEFACRSFRAPDPKAIFYSFPLWHEAPLHGAIRGTKQARQEFQRKRQVACNAQAIVEKLETCPAGEWIGRPVLLAMTCLTKDKFESGIKRLIEEGKIERQARQKKNKEGKKSSRHNLFFRLSDSLSDNKSDPTGDPTTNPTGSAVVSRVGSICSRPDPTCNGTSRRHPVNATTTTTGKPNSLIEFDTCPVL